jgi:hypothetical protein
MSSTAAFEPNVNAVLQQIVSNHANSAGLFVPNIFTLVHNDLALLKTNTDVCLTPHLARLGCLLASHHRSILWHDRTSSMPSSPKAQ